MDMNHKDVWTGEYKGVSYEIVKWSVSYRTIWNYYIIIPIEQIPVEYRKRLILKPKRYTMYEGGREHIMFPYSDSRLIGSLEWHGGCTYYDREYDGAGKMHSIKIGCDYAHAYDECQYYDTSTIYNDVTHTIDLLLEKVPLLKRCNWNGKYYKEADGSYVKNGIFVANENLEKWNKPL